MRAFFPEINVVYLRNQLIMENERYKRAKTALFDKLYEELNAMQRRAVYTVNGPLLVLAGAGSGKTTVLVKRIAHIISYGNAYFSDEGCNATDDDAEELERAIDCDKKTIATLLKKHAVSPCPPWAILAITFTNKAASEMRQRLASELGESASQEIWAGTFHSVCVRILRKYGQSVGIPPNFTIYDTEDAKKICAQVLKELRIDDKMFPVKTCLNAISRLKDALISSEDFKKEAAGDYRKTKIASVYELYEEKLRDANAVDFDDIIVKTVEMLRRDEEARNYYQRRFRYVLIDEYQDTNRAQFELAALLSGKYRNLMAVGDDDQSIYKFRGATIANILDFDKEYPDASVIKLEQNYRSTQVILDAANSIISNNTGRRGKNLWTDKKSGDKIVYAELYDQNAEGVYITDKILSLCRDENRKFSEFAVLYRMNAQSNSLEKVFAKSGISYRILGGTRFYDRKEIKDILSYLCLINNPADDLRLMRIINEPKRKIGSVTLDTVADIAAAEKCSMLDVIYNARSYEKQLGRSVAKLEEFGRLISELREYAEKASLSELFERTINDSGYREMLVLAGESEKERLENVEELISNAVEYQKKKKNATLDGFLEEVALVSDIDNYDREADAVVLMTVHSAKGLEFPVVFLPGMEEGIFPSQQSASEHEETEEERRLAYVAVTRAKEKLFITRAKERLFYGQTQYNPVSRFVREIPEKLIEYSEGGFSQRQRDTRQKVWHFDSVDEVRIKTHDAGTAHAAYDGRSAGYRQSDARNRGARAEIKQSAELIPAGSSVEHHTFGRGMVLSAKPMGSDILYEVAFDSVGTKKLMGNYAKLKKLS